MIEAVNPVVKIDRALQTLINCARRGACKVYLDGWLFSKRSSGKIQFLQMLLARFCNLSMCCCEECCGVSNILKLANELIAQEESTFAVVGKCLEAKSESARWVRSSG